MSENTKFEFSHLMPCNSKFLYEWHTMPNAFNRLLPYWEEVVVTEHPNKLDEESLVKIFIKLGPLRIPWILKHKDIKPGLEFNDIQIKGPFKEWSHSHKMQNINDNNSLLVEKINLKLPLFSSLLSKFFIKDKLKRLFNYRFKVIANDIKNHYKYKEREKMKILISGSTGLVGSALHSFLSSGGYDVYKLVRNKKAGDKEILWMPPNGRNEPSYLDPRDLEGFDAVIHLGGENIANKRWSEKQKEKIYNSRVLSTKLLSETLASLEKPPKVFICASAIGFYGDRDSDLLEEASNPCKSTFLGRTCIDWENATRAAADRNIRVINTRFGLILDPKGGALAKMLPIFQLGGGNLGNGKQWMSWIALDDVLGGILHCLMNENISGPVNFVAPNPVKNQDFTKTLATVLTRPAIFPVPTIALKVAFGEMAESLFLASAKVKAASLKNSGYEFSFPELNGALSHMLGK